MNVVLSILQGLGIVLLVLLLVILLLLLIVLYVPVRYEAKGEMKDTSLIVARFQWLLHLLRAKVVYEDDLVFVELYIFWMRKTFSFELGKEDESEEKDGAKTAKAENSKEAEGMINKIKGILNRIKEIWPKVKMILTDERNHKAVAHLKDEFFILIKILLPKKSKGDVSFSTGSPDTTGQTYGVLACLPVMYQEDWNIVPDFLAEQAYIIGNFWGKGRVYGYQILGIIFRIVFDKNCQRMYTMINKFIKYVKRK